VQGVEVDFEAVQHRLRFSRVAQTRSWLPSLRCWSGIRCNKQQRDKRRRNKKKRRKTQVKEAFVGAEENFPRFFLLCFSYHTPPWYETPKKNRARKPSKKKQGQEKKPGSGMDKPACAWILDTIRKSRPAYPPIGHGPGPGAYLLSDKSKLL
jgi:hypothetical protein